MGDILHGVRGHPVRDTLHTAAAMSVSIFRFKVHGLLVSICATVSFALMTPCIDSLIPAHVPLSLSVSVSLAIYLSIYLSVYISVSFMLFHAVFLIDFLVLQNLQLKLDAVHTGKSKSEFASQNNWNRRKKM